MHATHLYFYILYLLVKLKSVETWSLLIQDWVWNSLEAMIITESGVFFFMNTRDHCVLPCGYPFPLWFRSPLAFWVIMTPSRQLNKFFLLGHSVMPNSSRRVYRNLLFFAFIWKTLNTQIEITKTLIKSGNIMKLVILIYYGLTTVDVPSSA